MTPEEVKAVLNCRIADYHYVDDPPGTWRWMQIKSLSDDGTTLYFIPNGTGVCTAAPVKDIIIDKIG